MLDASAAAAAHAIGRGAGRIPAEGLAAPARPASEPEPGRAAAAAMPEAKLSVQGPIPAGSGSDLEADCRVTRSPAALTRAPAANEPPPVEEAVVEVPDAPVEQTATARPRRHGNRSALLLLVLLLVLAGLAWLFRPGTAPAPPVVEDPGTTPRDQAPASTASGDRNPGPSVDADAASERNSAPANEAVDTVTKKAPETATGGDADRPGEAVVATDTTPTDAPDEPPASVDESATARLTVPTADTASGGAAGARLPLPSAGDVPASENPATTPGKTTSASMEASAADSAAAAVDVAADAGGTLAASGGAENAGESIGSGTAADGAADTASSDGSPYFSGREYTVRTGDTLWDLADRNYVNPYYWPHIWNHNGDIANPDRLEVRQGLWLPTLEGEPRSLTEADRRSIAEGYLRLYRFFLDQGDANPQYALVGVRYFDASVLPERMRGTAAGKPGDTLAAVFHARLEAEFPLE